MPDLDPRLHFVAVTCIIEKDGKFLIAKRAANEKVFPNKWTVPGGKFIYSEYKNLPRTSESHPQWYNVVEFVCRKEVREEVGLEIEKPSYVTDLVFVRPDGYPVVTLSFWAKYKSGEVRINHEMSEFAWVTAEEAKDYDMIDGIPEEIDEVERLIKLQ
jgi:8-oxo-dGTP pyrophosphatase MutT (NUDIX family)